MTSKESNCNHVKHDIPHIRQQFDWDCGIACILMLLSENKREEVLEDLSQICLEEGFGKTTWTIDLCYLLKRFNIAHHMYTSRQSIDDTALDAEEADRVRNRFSNASYNGITIVENAFSTKELVAHVVTTGPAIALVDAALLSCDWCKHNKLQSEFRRIFGGGYRGHYIVIVGCSAGKLLYCNPARSHALCATTLKRLNAARIAPGTDGDTILIYKEILQ